MTIMKNLKYIFCLSLLMVVFSCEIDELPNPNGPSIEGTQLDATKSQLQTLVTGSEDLLRQEIGFYYDVVSILGREYYFFTGSDPRYTGELLGKGASSLDNAGFYGTRPYFGRYRCIKNLNVLIEAAQSSTTITQEELNGYLGFAKTFQAYELHLAANLQYTNGIRVETSDVDNLGAFVDYDAALTAIQSLLDEALGHLNNAGSDFPFSLSSAMDGFASPSSLSSFNRGLKARIALYQNDKATALSALQSSFINPGGDMNAGPARYYSAAGGDFANNLFRVPDQADAIIAHPSYVADAEVGDARLEKVRLRPSGTLTLDDLSGDYDVWVFRSLNDPVPYMTNSELILIRAEANIGSNNSAAVDNINLVRSMNGVSDYSGGTSDSELLDEVLYQRRYSLFGLGHRWVDMRRTGKLGDLPLDRAEDDVWEKFPRPVSEPQ
ncbi:MAG: RagB/SusD family nutrient uptake outer membrane protein [Chitinophagia bacterium]|nr:RagB/SusD family nutrient uptake outer membrane protein [Chitinophagia bacterium]